jgi:hypothetical protein
MHRFVLASLTLEQTLRQSIRGVAAVHVTGCNHPTQSDPKRGLGNAERPDRANQVPHRQLGRVGAEQEAEDNRSSLQRPQLEHACNLSITYLERS